jgi:hypothetical protein
LTTNNPKRKLKIPTKEPCALQLNIKPQKSEPWPVLRGEIATLDHYCPLESKIEGTKSTPYY